MYAFMMFDDSDASLTAFKYSVYTLLNTRRVSERSPVFGRITGETSYLDLISQIQFGEQKPGSSQVLGRRRSAARSLGFPFLSSPNTESSFPVDTHNVPPIRDHTLFH